MQLLQKQKGQVLLLLVCCILLVLIVKPWQLYFLNDDYLHIPLPKKWLFLRGGFMRPVANLLLHVDKLLYGTNATGFFVTTLIVHTGCVLTVYFFIQQVLKTYVTELSDTFIAFATSLLFLVYPFHAESLMWVLARGSIMTTMFALLSLLFYTRAGKHFWLLGLSWLCYVLALFTYEIIWNVLLLYAVISIADVQLRRVSFKKAALMFGIMLLTFLIYILIRIALLDTIAGDGYLEINENLTQPVLLITNFIKLTGRVFTPPFVNTSFAILFFALSVFAYAWLTFKIGRTNKQWGWLTILAWFAMLTSVVTAAPLGIDTHYNESERFIYFASVFYCFFIAFALTVLINKKWRVLLFPGIVLLFVLLLIPVQRHYRYASAITRQTVQFVSENTNHPIAYFIDVPQRYKGSMIFRVGLPEAIKWIVPQANYDSTVIVSRMENPAGLLPYKTGEVDWKIVAAEKGWPQDSPVIMIDNNLVNINRDDILYWYRADGIYKVKM